MITSLALMSIYGAPAVPLERICEEYLGLSRNEAHEKGCRRRIAAAGIQTREEPEGSLLGESGRPGETHRRRSRQR